MKKIWSLFFVILLLLMTGCRNQAEVASNAVSEDFMVNSIKWGSSWESVKDEPQLEGYTIVRDDGQQLIVQIDDFEYLGQKGLLQMLFIESEESFPQTGLIQAFWGYTDDVEKEIIAAMEEIYGERQSFYLDEQGIENPLNPPAWYSPETLRKSLSDEEQQEYLKKYVDRNYGESWMDALLRGPLVIITVMEEQNAIRFQGNDAAVVENFKK